MRYPTNWISITNGLHNGKCLDFGWCSHHNQTVYACDSGIVLKLENQYTGGNIVYIKHDNGFISMYAHLKSFKVKAGQRVNLGDPIAVMGNSGHVYNSQTKKWENVKEHLHFGLYSSEKLINTSTQKSDLNPFDYLEVYPNQSVREDTLKTYGKKIRYYNQTGWTAGKYELLYKKAVRKEPHLGNNIKKVKECASWAKSARDMLTSKKPNDDAYLKVGSVIDISTIIDEKGRIWGRWGKTGNDYIVLCNIDGSPQAQKVD